MHNFSTVVAFELTRTLKKKTFWLGILAFSIIYFSNKAGDSAQKQVESGKFSFVVHDDSKILNDHTLHALGAKRVTTTEGIAMVQGGKIDAFFDYPADITKQPVQVYNKDEGLIQNGKYTATAKLLLTTAVSPLVSPVDTAIIKGDIQTSQKSYADGQEVNNSFGKYVVPGLFLVVFYTVVVLLGNQMLTSTTEEKENRVTEMILTSISSRSLITGKIVSLLILGVVQIAVLALTAIAGYLIAGKTMNIPDISSFVGTIEFSAWPIALGASIMVGGLLLFTGLTVAIGAAMPTAKEAGSFFGFVIMLLMIPFWLTSLIVSDPSAMAVQIFSYFPLTAPVTLMLRNIVGTLNPAQGLIGVAVVFVTSIIIMAIAIRLFRYGTLEYSKRISLSAIVGRKKRSNKSSTK
jgi:ABC-2 type transport system permease protein